MTGKLDYALAESTQVNNIRSWLLGVPRASEAEGRLLHQRFRSVCWSVYPTWTMHYLNKHLMCCKAQMAWKCLFTPTFSRRAILAGKIDQTGLVFGVRW